MEEASISGIMSRQKSRILSIRPAMKELEQVSHVPMISTRGCGKVVLDEDGLRH